MSTAPDQLISSLSLHPVLLSFRRALLHISLPISIHDSELPRPQYQNDSGLFSRQLLFNKSR